MQALGNAQPLPREEMPERDPKRRPRQGRRAGGGPAQAAAQDPQPSEIDVAARLLARSDDVEMLAAGVREGLAILEGWRFEQFGRDALDLVEGRLAFTVYEGKLLMTRAEIGS
jgi:ribonuclease D